MRNLDILAAESGEHVRVLLCREEQSYVVSCQHFRMPYPVASDLLAELQPVPAETYSVFVLDEDITNRQREGRNRKLDLIAPLLEDACIYDKSHRNEVVRQIAAEHGIARRTVLQYLWRYWVYQSKNALLPAERPAPEQHELTADEKAIRWALNKYYYTPQRQSLQTAYKMMLRAKYCDTHGTLKSEYPTFWQFRYFFRKNRDPISETISRQGLKAYQRNHRPFTGSVCDYAHTIGVYMTDATIADIYIVSRLSRKPIGRPVIYTMVDAYSRLIHPSLENELRSELSAAAAEGAIKVFGDNLRQLLLQPPIRGKTVMGLDPGYRMGCKVAVVDPTGKVLDTNVVYPVPEFKRVDQAKKTIKAMVLKNGVEVMAIGNGTAGHETEEFAAEVIRELAEEKNLHLQYMVVSEAGASVYSASKLAAEEFPQYDVNLRSAVSIARRLQDPLAELVKIDPKAVGVGQYQHDMPQKRLNETLDGVVEDCVNSVGVDLNTASAPLLRRVAGVSAATAKNIVAWREEEGAFTSRAQLKKVKGLGPKAYEQCAGFLRLPEAKNRLDATAVHPESYAAAKALLDACGYTAAEIGTDRLAGLPGAVKAKGAGTLCALLGVGEPTLNDIVAELCKPGRDVRDSLPKPLLRSDVMGLDDLKPGMELTGTVRNVIDFGAFVDLGVHQDGLVHVSQISDKFIKHPRELLKVGDIVRVKVLSVDTGKKRIALTMKGVPQQN